MLKTTKMIAVVLAVVALTGAALAFKDGRLEYTGPNSSKLEFFMACPIVIHKATYGVDRKKRIDVTEKVKQIANGGRKVTASNHLVGEDPVPEVKKTLRIDFTKDGKRQTVVIPEGESFRHEGYRKERILPRIDGRTIDLGKTYNYCSPYMQSRAGSDIVTVRYGSRCWEYDFGKNTITEVAQ